VLILVILQMGSVLRKSGSETFFIKFEIFIALTFKAIRLKYNKI